VRGGGAEGLSNIAPDNPIWIRFAQAMTPLASTTAKRVAAYVTASPAPVRSVLDVAAGHGLYGIEIAKVISNAVVTAIDSAGVLSVARANAEAAGVERRYQTLAGNALAIEWGSGFDLVLLPNFLH